eukprot:5266696-Prymnesium_polylepis.2
MLEERRDTRIRDSRSLRQGHEGMHPTGLVEKRDVPPPERKPARPRARGQCTAQCHHLGLEPQQNQHSGEDVVGQLEEREAGARIVASVFFVGVVVAVVAQSRTRSLGGRRYHPQK